jgi:hypothetical protein
MTREICEYVHCVFPRQRKGTDAMSTDARTSTRQDPSPVGSDTRSGDTRCRAVRRPGTKAGTARHGPGGAGKTRLAIEAAGRSVDDVYMVELEPLTDGTDIPRPCCTRSASAMPDRGRPPIGADPVRGRQRSVRERSAPGATLCPWLPPHRTQPPTRPGTA